MVTEPTDTERLDFLEKSGKDQVLVIAGTWYSRKGYNERHKRHKSMRDAIDYAMKEEK